MTFTHLARIAAVLVLLAGGMQLFLGIIIATGFHNAPSYEEALRLYAPGSSSWGQVVDKGIYKVLFAIALGTLAEIGFSTRKGAVRGE
jgi:hypothetical protein